MRADAKISVVIPTYDRAALVVEAVRSVRAQTLAPLEILVVDDGSTDDTEERLAAEHPPPRFLRQDHRGVAAARNLGVREARGEWVAFLDSDDRWEPDALSELAAAAAAHPDAGLMAMRARYLRADGTPEPGSHGKKSPGPFYSTASLLGPDTGGVLTPMVRRDRVLEAGGFDERLASAEDCDLWIRLSFHNKLVCVPKPLLLRRRHAGSLTTDRGLNARCWLRLLERLQREHPEFVRDHPAVIRRARAKEHLRLGRELLAAGDRSVLEEARRHLRRSIRISPRFPRAFVYLLAAYVAPSAYASMRRSG